MTKKSVETKTELSESSVPSRLFDKRIEDEFPKLEEYVFESADSLCKRFDIGISTVTRILRENRVTRHKVTDKAVRYRVMDLVRLIDKDLPSQQRS